MKAPILITGCARSGSSMIAKVVHMCGAFGGKISDKAHFQNQQIMALEEEYFSLLGTDPKGQHPLPNPKDISIPVSWRERVEKVILKQGYTEGSWMYKSSTMGLIWQIWDYAFPNAKWILVRRRTGDVIQSCLKTNYMRAFHTQDEWLQWIKEYEKRFVAMLEAGVNCKIIWPERMVQGDYAQLYETLDWLGLKWKSEVVSFIDPLLWHSRNKEKEAV